MTSPNVTYIQTNRPGCLIQILWFALVGWWLGAIWAAVAWLLMLTVIGLPISASMLNNVPQVMALRGRRPTVAAMGHAGKRKPQLVA